MPSRYELAYEKYGILWNPDGTEVKLPESTSTGISESAQIDVEAMNPKVPSAASKPAKRSGPRR